MMKKTLLALAASLAFAGMAQAQSVSGETQISISIDQSCAFLPIDNNQVDGFLDGPNSSIYVNENLSVQCNLNTPFTVINVGSEDGFITLTDSETGSQWEVLVESREHHAPGPFTDAGVEYVGTGAPQNIAYGVNFSTNAKNNYHRPEAGFYQGVINWQLVH